MLFPSTGEELPVADDCSTSMDREAERGWSTSNDGTDDLGWSTSERGRKHPMIWVSQRPWTDVLIGAGHPLMTGQMNWIGQHP